MGLTDLLIRKLKVPEKGQKTHFDDVLPGFGIRVSQGGTKTFVLKYGKKRSLKTLGRYPTLSLADARKQARRVQGEILAVPQIDGTVPDVSFDEARERFLLDSAKRTKPKTYEEYERLLRKHFQFDKQLSEVTRQDVMKAVTALSDKPSIEQHAFVALRTMMNWCVRHGLVSVSPVPPLRFTTTARSRILTDDELRTVWHRAEEVGYPYGTIVQLLILTGQRRGEIAGLRRSWIEGDEIIFPQGFTKNKREHRIPIGTLTKEVIETISGETDLLFPSRYLDETPFNGWSKTKQLFDRPIDVINYTMHDLRRTYATKLAELDTPIQVTERLLNHISGTVSGVSAVYNRHTYWEEMRFAVDSWEVELVKVAGIFENPDLFRYSSNA